VPDESALRTPHKTKPAANAQYDGNSVHRAKPTARSSAASASSRRREYTSAQAPEGTSRAMVTTDQSTNSDEIWAADNPASANSSA